MIIKTKNILLIPGDGIGPEVVAQAKKVIEFFGNNSDKKFTFDEALLGGIAYDKAGTPFPAETLEKAKNSDAILLGAVGGPKWESLDYANRPERGLLGIRKELGLFANLRPAVVFEALASSSTLKPEIVSGLDIMIVRELTGDVYFGEPRGVETLPNGDRKGVNTMVYTTPEVTRIAKVAFELAKKRGKKLCSIDKANVLESTEMWREEVTKVGEEYPQIELSHMYVDNAAMQLVRNPKQFDVVVTGNLFGDILSDLASMATGSLGMLPSASLGAKITEADGKTETQHALYEPIHGSAPDIAGKNIANPIATISSLAMMFRYSFNYEIEANIIDDSIKNVLNKGLRTADIAKAGESTISTSQMGDAIIEEISSLLLKTSKKTAVK
ncbi:MAG: 3-isopropylmalate dehydrogenase [Lentimonas sp.]|jgi:3-isopropylmalate dehydrogenase